MPRRAEHRRWRHPALVWLIVLFVIFATEAGVMAFLPIVLPPDRSRFFEAAVDAVLLTSLLAPLLWLMLVRPLREINRLRAAFLSDLFASIEADRRQIALDLHDGVGQSLTMLVSGLRSAAPSLSDPASAERCLQLKNIAKQALADIKRLALGLRPSLLDDLGLAPALERIVADVRENSRIDIQLDAQAVSDRRLSSEMETALFRIIQEALSNVVRHSKAHFAAVRIAIEGGDVVAEVVDDGVGIPVSLQSGRNPGHLGLTGMKERATLLGGDVEIASSPNDGTHLTIRMPIQGAIR